VGVHECSMGIAPTDCQTETKVELCLDA